MAETSTHKTLYMYPQLDNGIKFRLNEIKEKKTILLLNTVKEKQ